jgi:L-fuconolactonase
MVITDCQVHLWAADSPDRPWPADRHSPHRIWPMGPEEMIANLDAAGVTRAVIVPPSWEGIRNDLALQAVADYPGRFAVMGRIDLRAPSSVDLGHWRETPGMLGVRVIDTKMFTTDLADWFWPAAEAADIPVMLSKPGFVDPIGTVALAHPNLRLIVDHLNVPWYLSHVEIGLAVGDLLGLAKYPNVAVKVSALPNRLQEQYPFPSFRPILERLLDAFGAERLMWGSDITALSCPYADWVRAIPEAEYLSDAEKALIMGGTLSKWLGWPEPE